MSYLKTDSGAELYYQDQGRGAPVVLIHGWPLNGDMWEYQAAALVKRGLRVISYDRRGFGRSSKPVDGHDYDTLAADLKSLLEKLDLRQATLVGFSMGGGEVVRYLSRFGSERVSRAVLVSSVVPYVLKTEDNPDGVPKEVLDGFVQKIDEDRPAFLQEFGKQFYGVGLLSKPVSQALLDWTQGLALQADHTATASEIRTFSETDFRAELPKINVPTLIIHGDADKTVPIDATSKVAAKLLPNAQLKIYEGAPHGLFYTERQRLNDDLIGFIQAGR